MTQLRHRPDGVTTTARGGIVVTDLAKSYGETVVLHDVDLHVPQGEFHALLGPSGSGKTTLLRVIAGFTPADQGMVSIAGRDITGLPVEERNIGVVFQNYALFPHMTVEQNVAFGLRMRKLSKNAAQPRVRAALEMVGLAAYSRRRPKELSGGQQQRVALARALVIEPDVLLLDEPLSALDRKIRQSVRVELKRIQRETGVTTIIVTHDQEEALYLADRVFVLDDGRIRQSGPPAEVYRNPSDSFVAGFVGELNVIPAVLTGATLQVGGQQLDVPADAQVSTTGTTDVELQVRPEDVLTDPAAGDHVPDRLRGRIVESEFNGPVVTLHIDIDGVHLTSLRLAPGVLDDPRFQVGAAVDVGFNSRGVRIVPRGESVPVGAGGEER